VSLSNNTLTTSARSRLSAGVLFFRRRGDDVIEFLLVHPGGPFFSRKDEGAWTIPKGEVATPDEDLLTRARVEFGEELGFEPKGAFVSLGKIRQKGGKTVHAWACEGNLPPDFVLRSNTFELEWPPRSGKRETFPEVDRAEFFTEEVARRKINPAQVALLDRLLALVHSDSPNG
jgi:predicted NUDIX family NTP pyrophosphohydrolase